MRKGKIITLCFILFSIVNGMGHPMPHSIFSFDVKSDKIIGHLRIPLKELQHAVPFDVTEHPESLLQPEKRQLLSDYFKAHIIPKSTNGQDWYITIADFSLEEAEQTATGQYQELIIELVMQPPPGESVRDFDLYYDAIVHQVITHKIFVTASQDWQNGNSHGEETSLGAIELNIADNTIPPLHVALDEGSAWKGFVSMVWLGISHIAEGSDHILFLLVLLLPAALIPVNGRWTKFAGSRKSVMNILKIVTAFTIGHSFSLLLGAKQWLVLPQQPVEIAITFTILITAIHAIRPIFPHREMVIATLFGLVHGLAFSTVISELNLDTRELWISILGYNIGIEIMQIFVIILVMPWIIILSKNGHFKWIRIGGAIFGIIAAIGWMYERIMLQSNGVTTGIESLFLHGKWLVLVVFCMAAVSTFVVRYQNKTQTLADQEGNVNK